MNFEPTLTERLDLAVKCGVPMETLRSIGFYRHPDEPEWRLDGTYLSQFIGDDDADFIETRRASIALDAVCVEWLGKCSGGYRHAYDADEPAQWVVRIEIEGSWAFFAAPTLTLAIHATMINIERSYNE